MMPFPSMPPHSQNGFRCQSAGFVPSENGGTFQGIPAGSNAALLNNPMHAGYYGGASAYDGGASSSQGNRHVSMPSQHWSPQCHLHQPHAPPMNATPGEAMGRATMVEGVPQPYQACATYQDLKEYESQVEFRLAEAKANKDYPLAAACCNDLRDAWRHGAFVVVVLNTPEYFDCLKRSNEHAARGAGYAAQVAPVRIGKEADAVGGGDETSTKALATMRTKFLTADEGTTWDQLVGIDDLKERIWRLVDDNARPEQWRDGDDAKGKNFLLAGPPGTGKSSLMTALISELNRHREEGNKFSLLSLTAADIKDAWVGSSERNVQAAFAAAKERQPCFIFIDEADGLSAERSHDGADSAGKQVVSQLLIETTKVLAQKSQIYLAGATNLPWKLDEATRRRFSEMFYVPVPGPEGRLALLQSLTEKKDPMPADLLKELAYDPITENFSQSDIRRTYRLALRNGPEKRLDEATCYERQDDGALYPCRAPNAAEKVVVGRYQELRMKYTMGFEPLTIDDLRRAFTETGSTTQTHAGRWTAWAAEFCSRT